MAGWTGLALEPGATGFSNLVMARDFWFKRLSHRRLRRSGSFTAVHPNSRHSPLVVETIWRRVGRPTPRDALEPQTSGLTSRQETDDLLLVLHSPTGTSALGDTRTPCSCSIRPSSWRGSELASQGGNISVALHNKGDRRPRGATVGLIRLSFRHHRPVL